MAHQQIDGSNKTSDARPNQYAGVSSDGDVGGPLNFLRVPDISSQIPPDDPEHLDPASWGGKVPRYVMLSIALALVGLASYVVMNKEESLSPPVASTKLGEEDVDHAKHQLLQEQSVPSWGTGVSSQQTSSPTEEPRHPDDAYIHAQTWSETGGYANSDPAPVKVFGGTKQVSQMVDPSLSGSASPTPAGNNQALVNQAKATSSLNPTSNINAIVDEATISQAVAAVEQSRQKEMSAQRLVDQAQLALTEYQELSREGLRDAEQKVVRAQEQLNYSEFQFNQGERQARKGLLSLTRRDALKFPCKRAQLNLEDALANRDLVRRGLKPEKLAVLQENLNRAFAALDEIQASHAYQIVQLESLRSGQNPTTASQALASQGVTPEMSSTIVGAESHHIEDSRPLGGPVAETADRRALFNADSARWNMAPTDSDSSERGAGAARLRGTIQTRAMPRNYERF